LLKASDFFDLNGNPFALIFEQTEYVWEGLKQIKPFLQNNLQPNVAVLRKGSDMVEKTAVLYQGEVFTEQFKIDSSGKKPVVTLDGKPLEGASIIYAGAYLMDDQIYIGAGTVIEPTALVKGPAWLGNNTEVRHGAYIRGDVLVGDGCVVGHTTEIKSSVMLGGSKAGHFAYIGDSILGRVNLGAGTKLANLKVVETPVVVKFEERSIETGLRKFGAILGDGVEMGCNSVTAPGTILGKNVIVYPNGTARGYYPPGIIVRVRQQQELSELEKAD
jgi:bifunctional N-acetylglucosamine-1-phosphate-uridyltransferase/glucosamine-1-phosphate-acetyltransferase GlmU-like protein